MLNKTNKTKKKTGMCGFRRDKVFVQRILLILKNRAQMRILAKEVTQRAMERAMLGISLRNKKKTSE